jgi:hypothetical protein
MRITSALSISQHGARRQILHAKALAQNAAVMITKEAFLRLCSCMKFTFQTKSWEDKQGRLVFPERPVVQSRLEPSLWLILPQSKLRFSIPLAGGALLPQSLYALMCVTNAGVDHCAQQDHGCEQLCLNTEESFVCQCSEGFVINEDLKTCSSESLAPLWRRVCNKREMCGHYRGQQVRPVPFPLPFALV